MPNSCVQLELATRGQKDLIWTGDNIGLGGCDEPILIGLRDGNGREAMVSLERMLQFVERIDVSGWQRLAEALPSCAKDGYMTPEDLTVWRAAEQRIADLMYESARDFDVSFWVVVEDRNEDGRRVLGVPLSPKFATKEQCQEAAVEIKATKPNAYLGCHTIFFHWARPGDMAERKRLLDEILSAEVSHV